MTKIKNGEDLENDVYDNFQVRKMTVWKYATNPQLKDLMTPEKVKRRRNKYGGKVADPY